ncbi:MAG TPA: hypothetical protein VFN31_00180 [Candidatus Saccharimonadales bacterium]|nr:hypothetical protein [Candidatus Saccharimonadales bacterium]
MIQLNLLPDVKLAYIKAQKVRSLATGISVIVSGAAILILVLLLLFGFAQKHSINNLKNDITAETNKLKSKPNIDKILTVQNQLGSLTKLYAGRPAASRLFDTYLNEVTPDTISINQMQVSYTQNTIYMTGSADSLTTINQYIDTLKLTTYTTSNSSESLPAFSNVVLSSFGLNSNAPNPNQAANFTINLNFAPSIFDITTKVNMTVPNITLTHAELSDTGSLFVSAPSNSTNSTGGK